MKGVFCSLLLTCLTISFNTAVQAEPLNIVLQEQPTNNVLEPESTLSSSIYHSSKVRVIVTFKDKIDVELVAKYGRVIDKLQIVNGVLAIIRKKDIDALKKEHGVADVIRDAIVSTQLGKKRLIDNRFLDRGEGPGYKGRSIIVGWNLQEPGIAAEATWGNYSLDGSGTIIAFLDTGVNYNLEDLNVPYYLGGFDFVNNDNNPIDDNASGYGHGTVVTTVAVAQGEEKIKGAAPRASYYAVKVLDANGLGSVLVVIQGINWCVYTANPKPDIINMSFGIYDGPLFPPELRQLFENACNNAYNEGIILAASAGNEGYVYSGYPARFYNVISAGGHDQSGQLLYYPPWSIYTNGGGDVVAPAQWVPSMDMWGDASYVYIGTSLANPHIAGLIALQLQYARANKLQINNGYEWESMKHSAIDLGLDPDFQGKGKARALENIDLIAGEWPLPSEFEYSGEAYWFDVEIDGEIISVPAYYIGTYMYQDINLTNATNTLGGYPSDVVNLAVTATQQYYGMLGEIDLPGSPVTSDSGITVNAGSLYTLDVSYYLPYSIVPGLDKTNLSLSFNFYGDPRVITYVDPYASIWCPPESINEGFPEIR